MGIILYQMNGNDGLGTDDDQPINAPGNMDATPYSGSDAADDTALDDKAVDRGFVPYDGQAGHFNLLGLIKDDLLAGQRGGDDGAQNDATGSGDDTNEGRDSSADTMHDDSDSSDDHSADRSLLNRAEMAADPERYTSQDASDADNAAGDEPSADQSDDHSGDRDEGGRDQGDAHGDDADQDNHGDNRSLLNQAERDADPNRYSSDAYRKTAQEAAQKAAKSVTQTLARAGLSKSSIERYRQNWQAAREIIVDAAHRAHVDPGVLAKICGFESGFKNDARPISKDNPGQNKVVQFDGTKAISSAYGYGQFLNASWAATLKKYGEKYGIKNIGNMSTDQLNALRKDPNLQAAMLAEFTRDNASRASVLGGSNDDANVYSMHNLGTGDAAKFLTALKSNPDKKVSDVLSKSVISGNPSLYGNGSISVAQAYGNMGKAMSNYNAFADDARALYRQKYGEY